MNNGERKLCENQLGMSGWFFENLFRTITIADTGNQILLSRAFPEEVEAVKRFQNERGYWQKLEKEFKEGFAKKEGENNDG